MVNKFKFCCQGFPKSSFLTRNYRNSRLKVFIGATKWDPDADQKLIELMQAEFPIKDIYQVFSSKFSQSAVQNKMRTLQKNLHLKTTPESPNLEKFEDSKWPLEDVKILVSLIKARFKLKDIAKRIPSRSVSEVRRKVEELLKRQVEELHLLEPQTLWSQEEVTLLLDLKKSGETFLGIALALGRSKSSIKNKVQNLGAGRKMSAFGHNWELFQSQGFLQVPVEQWPAHNIKNNSKSLCFFVLPAFLTSQNVDLVCQTLRGFILKAEQLEIQNINLWIVQDKEALEAYLLTARRPRLKAPPKLRAEFRDLIRATLLTDGTIVRLAGKTSPGYRFEFVQAATFLMNTKELESHLEYVLWFYTQLDPYYYQPNSFRLSRGVKLHPKNQLKTEFKFTWKARVILNNFADAELYYKDFYGSKNSSLSSAPAQKLRKELPQISVLRNYFEEGNLNFLLAHMFMQDGSASTERCELTFALHRTVALYVFSGSVESNERLAFVIWERTGLKFRPRTAKGEGKPKTTLFLCLSSVPDFFQRINLYLLPCMFYKRFEVTDLSRIPDVVSFQEKEFNKNLKTWQEKFG